MRPRRSKNGVHLGHPSPIWSTLMPFRGLWNLREEPYWKRLDLIVVSVVFRARPKDMEGTGKAMMEHGIVRETRELIVVIDDSPTVRKIVEVCLQREDFEVIGFPDGMTALRWLFAPGARIPLVIFVDLQMPGLDGFQVMTLLRSRWQFTYTEIFVLSRHTGVVERLKARLAGASGYLAKPVTTQQLIRVVSSMIQNAPIYSS